MARALVVAVVVALCVCFAAAESIVANGDKQLNNVVSRVVAQLAYKYRIDDINTFFLPETSFKNLAVRYEPFDSCQREIPKYPVGTLENVISSGTLKICLDVREEGDIAKGALFARATKNYPVLGVVSGELYGPAIEIGNRVANELGLLLEAPITASFRFCDSKQGYYFEDTYSCLKQKTCDVSTLNFYQDPYREEFVDFTCPSHYSDRHSVFQKNVVPELPIDNETTPSICTVLGSSQSIHAKAFYPKSELKTYSNLVDMWLNFCLGNCEMVVDTTTQGKNFINTLCSNYNVQSYRLPLATTQGYVGMMTRRAYDVTRATFSDLD